MDTRERLLEAAITLLHEQGYARTTTRQIVAEADAHVPAVNYFYGSKDRLMLEAVEEALRRWITTTMDAAHRVDAAHPRERLRISIEQFLTTLDTDRKYVVAAVEAFAQAERSDELRNRLADAYRDFRSVVAHAVDETEPASSTTINIATVLIALFDGLALQWLLDPERIPSADQILDALDALGDLLGPEPAR